jgi:retron-type reverse transcriptase
MVCFWVADGGTAASNGGYILNKQLRTNDKGWSSILGVGHGTNNPSQKKKACYETINRASDLDRFLDKSPKQRNMDMRFGTSNIRSLYRAGSLMKVLREAYRYRFNLVGVQEVR